MPVNFDADWEKIKQNKQARINKNNQKYSPGDLVTLERTGIIPKLSIPRMGPYAVVTAHENGNVTIQKEPFLTDRVNIRRCKPYHRKIED